jgi:hypothetical protein
VTPLADGCDRARAHAAGPFALASDNVVTLFDGESRVSPVRRGPSEPGPAVAEDGTICRPPTAPCTPSIRSGASARARTSAADTTTELLRRSGTTARSASQR